MKLGFAGVLAGLAVITMAHAGDVVFGKDFTISGDPIAGKADFEKNKEKPMLLYWGSIKCPRCTAHTKDFARFTRSAEKDGIPVIAIQSEQADVAALKDYIKDNRINAAYYPNYTNLRYLTSNPDIKKVFNGIPLFIVIEPGGKVVSWHTEVQDAARALKKLEKK